MSTSITEIARTVSIVSCALFAGTAYAINVIVVPVMFKSSETSLHLLRIWEEHYDLAAPVQVSLIVVSSIASLIARGGRPLPASLLLSCIIPFTFLAIMPVNKELKAMRRQEELKATYFVPFVKARIQRWSYLHAVRTVASLGSLIWMIHQ